MGVLRLHHWNDEEHGRSGGWGAAALEARLCTMGAQRTGHWRLHCSVFSLKQSAKTSGVGAAPLFLLKSDNRTFALHNQRLLQGGAELQHILLQALTLKGGPPLKPRLSGSIVRRLPPSLRPSPSPSLSPPAPSTSTSTCRSLPARGACA